MQLTDTSLLSRTSDGTGTPVHNPATSAILGWTRNDDEAAVTRAVETAAAAFKSWSKTTARQRATVLRNWYDLIRANSEDLSIILTSEQGKPLAEARGEIQYAASYVEFYAEQAKRLNGEILPGHRPDTQMLVLRQPHGVVAAITPWNFPAAMITRKVAPALAAGCTMVLKPAPDTPLTALALAELAYRAGIPHDAFQIVTGDAKSVGAVLTSHPDVRMISFTGSTPVGKLLMTQAASTLKHVALELGGNAPFIVFDDADLAAAADGAIISKFRNMGQTCVCTNRFYVQENVYDAFVALLSDRIAKLRVGNGLDPDVEQGPLINEMALRKVETHVEDAIDKGAALVAGGHRHALGGTFFEPTILTGVNEGMRIAQEETFGPVAAIFRFKDEDEVLSLANDTDTGLAAYAYTRDNARTFRLMNGLEYGMVGINTGLISTEIAPFGGTKQSGNSREGSHHGLHEYTYLRYVCVDSSAERAP